MGDIKCLLYTPLITIMYFSEPLLKGIFGLLGDEKNMYNVQIFSYHNVDYRKYKT